MKGVRKHNKIEWNKHANFFVRITINSNKSGKRQQKTLQNWCKRVNYVAPGERPLHGVYNKRQRIAVETHIENEISQQ